MTIDATMLPDTIPRPGFVKPTSLEPKPISGDQ